MSNNSTSQSDKIAKLSRHFTEFAIEVCRGRSDVYEKLCLDIASDGALLELASFKKDSQPASNMILAAVKYLIEGSNSAPALALKELYKQAGLQVVSGSKVQIDNQAIFDAFKEFALENQDAVKDILQTRFVQTNEVRRCTGLQPAFNLVFENGDRKPLALVEIGCSAGLNLLFDKWSYLYSFNDGTMVFLGDEAEETIVLECDITSDTSAEIIPTVMPIVQKRIGLDLHPVDLSIADELDWQKALIWPEHNERLERMEKASAIKTKQPLELIEGSVFDILPDFIAKHFPELKQSGHESFGLSPASAGAEARTVCFFHAYVIQQWSKEERQDFIDLLCRYSYGSSFYLISLAFIDERGPLLEISKFHKGAVVTELVAKAEPHGKWLDWLKT